MVLIDSLGETIIGLVGVQAKGKKDNSKYSNKSYVVGMGNSVLGLDLMLNKLLFGQIFYAGERKIVSGVLQRKPRMGNGGRKWWGFKCARL